jgi:hypothetical protein
LAYYAQNVEHKIFATYRMTFSTDNTLIFHCVQNHPKKKNEETMVWTGVFQYSVGESFTQIIPMGKLHILTG